MPRRRHAVLGVLGGGACLVVAVSACTNGLPDPLPTDVPYAYHLQTEPGGDSALLEGTLALEDGCLVVMPSVEEMDEAVRSSRSPARAGTATS